MTKIKISVVITARPSYSRIKSFLLSLKKDHEIELQLIVAGSALLSKYGNATEVIEKDGFDITEKIHFLIEGNQPSLMSKSTGLALIELSTILKKINTDAIVVIADRYETIAVSIAASYQNIPLIHLQGGEISGNIDNKVRNANSSLADFHFVSNQVAKSRLTKRGIDPETIFITGCPSIDIAKKVLINPKLPRSIFNDYTGVGPIFDISESFLVVLQHPVTNEYGAARDQIEQTLEAVHQSEINTIWLWPNPDAGTDQISAGIRHFREMNPDNKIHFFKNIEPDDFLNLLLHSKCLVGNSSVGIRECSFLGVPAINIGSRQKLRDHSKNVIHVGYDKNEIYNAIQKTNSLKRNSNNLYGNGNAGNEMLEILKVLKQKL